MKKKTMVLLCAAAAAAVVSAGVAAWYAAGAYSGQEVRLYFPENSTAAAVRDTLESNLGKSFGGRVYGLLSEPEKVSGSYVAAPGTAAWRLARNIGRNRQTPVRVTFNNIRLMDELAQRISARMEFTAADFTAAADTVLPALGFETKESFPAAFFPDSYEFYWTDRADKVVRTLASEYEKFWTTARLKKAEALKLTPVEVATVASIVEEETARADERPKVARLYLNRLEKGMRLQADPTVKFALQNFALRRIGGEMLKTSSPYNTYVVNGLPPGPIRIVERATLDAVLDAPQHNYIYMCASPAFSGYHLFTADYASHQANARQYQQRLNERNIH